MAYEEKFQLKTVFFTWSDKRIADDRGNDGICSIYHIINDAFRIYMEPGLYRKYFSKYLVSQGMV